MKEANIFESPFPPLQIGEELLLISARRPAICSLWIHFDLKGLISLPSLLPSEMLSFKVMAVHQSLNVKKKLSPDPLPDFLGHGQGCEPSEGQKVIALPTKHKK